VAVHYNDGEGDAELNIALTCIYIERWSVKPWQYLILRNHGCGQFPDRSSCDSGKEHLSRSRRQWGFHGMKSMNDLCETDGLEADRIQIVSGFPGAFKKLIWNDVFSEFESS
jgi:hypothetical protein